MIQSNKEEGKTNLRQSVQRIVKVKVLVADFLGKGNLSLVINDINCRQSSKRKDEQKKKHKKKLINKSIINLSQGMENY